MIPTTTFNATAATKRGSGFEVIVNSAMSEGAVLEASVPDVAVSERDPAQWHQAIGLARQACARIFRDGGRPADAVAAFGLTAHAADWSKAVALVAEQLCTTALRRAA